jgi:hypothetical protein
MSGTTADDKDRFALDLLLRGFQVSRMLRVVADLGVADRIANDDALAVADLAAGLNVHSIPLLRILRGLAAFRRLPGLRRRGGLAFTALATVTNGHTEQSPPRRPLLDHTRLLERLGNARGGANRGQPSSNGLEHDSV